jgi:hypothetical protein
MKKKSILAGCAALACVAPALAIFGLGDIVFDPTNFEEAVQQLVQLEQQYAQLVQTYHMIQSQYQQMLWMAKQDPVNMFLRYRAMATPWTSSSATNTYGTTAAWTLGINSGQSIQAAYSSAVQRLSAYGSDLANVPADQTDRIKTGYATVELTDGANRSSMQTIGSIRGNAAAVETAIQNLENDSLSSDPNMNTEIAVLNKINAANVIGLRNTQDTNKLLVALAEHEILQAKRQRDAEAQAFALFAQSGFRG